MSEFPDAVTGLGVPLEVTDHAGVYMVLWDPAESVTNLPSLELRKLGG